MPNLQAGIKAVKIVRGQKIPQYRIVKLTDVQMGKLGFMPDSKPIVVGHGDNGTAYMSGISSDSIIKLTTDPRDAVVSYFIKSLGKLPTWAIPVYGVWKLRGHAFAICTAKAEDLPQNIADPIDDIFEFTDEINLRKGEWCDFHTRILARIQDLEDQKTLEEAAKNFRGDITTGDIHARTKLMRAALATINEAVIDLEQFGFDFADFHSDNFKLHAGRPVVVDFGMNKMGGNEEYPELAKIPVLMDF